MHGRCSENVRNMDFVVPFIKVESEREVGEVILELTQRMPGAWGILVFWWFGCFLGRIRRVCYGITFVLEDDSTEICSVLV